MKSLFCIYAGICVAGLIVSSSSNSENTLFANGVGLECKTTKLEDGAPNLFFIFSEKRDQVTRLFIDTGSVVYGKILKTDMSSGTLSWLDKEGFSNTRYRLDRQSLTLATYPGTYKCMASSTEKIKERAEIYVSDILKNKKI